MRSRTLYGAFLCLIAAVSWGAMFPAAHVAFQHIDPFYFTVIRYGSVSLLLVLLLLWKEGKRAFRLEGRGMQLWFYGTMAFTVYNLFIFWGQDMAGEPGIMAASIMESLMPMISLVIGWIIFRKRSEPFTLFCVIVSFIGAVLVITKGDLHSLMDLSGRGISSMLMLIAVIGWVIYTMGGSKFPGWSVLRYTTLSCLLGTITAMSVTAVTTLLGYTKLPSFGDVFHAGPELIFVIVFPGIIALLGWNTGVNILSPVQGLLFLNFVPVTTLAVTVVQGYAITWFDVVGTIFIIASLVTYYMFAKAAHKKPAAAAYVKPVRGIRREGVL